MTTVPVIVERPFFDETMKMVVAIAFTISFLNIKNINADIQPRDFKETKQL